MYPPQSPPDSKTPTLSRCSFPKPRECRPSWQKGKDDPASPELIRTSGGRGANPPARDPCRDSRPCPHERRRLQPRASANSGAAIPREKFPRAFRLPEQGCASAQALRRERRRETSDPGCDSGDWLSRCKAARYSQLSTAKELPYLPP